MKVIGCVVVGLLITAVVAVFSFDRGTRAGNAFEAVKMMTVVERQHECIAKSDSECVAASNEAMARIVAGRLSRSDLGALEVSDRAAAEAYLRSLGSPR